MANAFMKSTRNSRRVSQLICRALLVCLGVAVPTFAEVDYARDVQPVLAEHCFGCHGPDQQEAGFRLDDFANVTRAADSGVPPVVPGDAVASELIARVTSTDPDERMPPEGDTVPDKDIENLKAWIAAGAKYTQHWAYRPLDNERPPEIQNPDWALNPVDLFVAARLEQQSITASPSASRSTLIKRLHYDLLGLPPTVEEVKAFEDDSAPDAYPRLVDRLLESPRFGERWGRHWLDKARYADSDGYEKDNARPNAWHYRDWVIRALNEDLPFDEFTVQQLAGDLLDDANDAQKLATAFNRQTLTNTEGGTDREQWRVAAVMDRTETLGTVWLGLTVGCARCHNHKYDQISQDEYYQLYAFFDNGDETTMEVKTEATDKTKLRVVTQRTKDPRTTRVLRRGDFLQPLHEVRSGTLGSLPEFRSRRRHADAAADRLDLARWLVDGQNPLPPRVAANHIWKHLFGFGLVRTANDFGIRGEMPTHPRLLDWLAANLVRNDWSRKWLIRTIVLSSTYQQSSAHREELADTDPQNRTLHRQNRFRVEAEVIRDISLAASGLLSSELGGPSVFPPIPDSVTDLTYNSGFKWKTSEGNDRYRRGMYTFFKRTAPHPNLITFDCPSSNVTSVARETSNTPTAALVTLNNTVYIEAAREFARQLQKRFSSHQPRIEYALQSCLARTPGKSEVDRLMQLTARSQAWYARHPEAAKELTGGGDAELAALTVAARVILNLDEFITRE